MENILVCTNDIAISFNMHVHLYLKYCCYLYIVYNHPTRTKTNTYEKSTHPILKW